MYTYVFKGKNGQKFAARGYDADRARIAAKKAAGSAWDKTARLVSIRREVLA